MSRKYLFIWLIGVVLGCGHAQVASTSTTNQKSLILWSTNVQLAAGGNLLGAAELNGYNQYGWLRFLPNASGSTIDGFKLAPYGDTTAATYISGTFFYLYNDDPTLPITVKNHGTGGGADASNWISTYDGHDVTLLPGEWMEIGSQATFDAEYNPTYHGWIEKIDRSTYLARTPTQPARTIGTAWQPNTARATNVVLSLTATCALTLTGGEVGHIDVLVGATSSPTTVVGSVPCGNTGAVVVGVNSTVTTGGTVSYIVKPGDFVKVTTTNTTGAPSYTLAVTEEQL